MAAEDAAYRKVESFEGAMFAEGFQGILGTGRSETTAWAFERGDADLIEPYQKNERSYGNLLEDYYEFILCLTHFP